MADNILVTQGTGTTMATDDVSGVQYPRVKVSVGVDGAAIDVSSSNPMPVEVSSLPLPAGAATQATLAALLAELELKANLTETQPVSAATLPLPTGAATSAAQTTGNNSLSSIDGKLPALSSGKVPVDTGLTQSLTDAQLRASAVPVSGPLTDAQLRASAVPVTFTGGSDASAANQTLQITEATLTNTRLTNVTGADGAAAPANALVMGGVTSGGTFQTFETNASGHLNISDGGGSITVDGPLTDTQLRASAVPVSGPLTDAQLRASAVPVSGPLTDAQLRATAVPTAPNITRGSGVIDSNTQRVTLATDGATAVAIGSIDTKTPVLDNSKQPVVPSMTTGGNISVQTAATGTNWTAFASQALKQLTVSNQTGTSVEFRQGGAGVGFIVPIGSIFTFFGITNANQIEARRVDTSNTQVTVTARWES